MENEKPEIIYGCNTDPDFIEAVGDTAEVYDEVEEEVE